MASHHSCCIVAWLLLLYSLANEVFEMHTEGHPNASVLQFINTQREAVASAKVTLGPEVFELVSANAIKKVHHCLHKHFLCVLICVVYVKFGRS